MCFKSLALDDPMPVGASGGPGSYSTHDAQNRLVCAVAYRTAGMIAHHAPSGECPINNDNICIHINIDASNMNVSTLVDMNINIIMS